MNQLKKNEEFETYSKVEEKDKWKINLVKEIKDVRFETIEKLCIGRTGRNSKLPVLLLMEIPFLLSPFRGFPGVFPFPL